MALSYGFYNSLDGDRKYDAEDFGRMFDGIITDGVIGSVGDAFAVKAAGENKITVGSGRAWFNHTWSYNDAPVTLTLKEADALSDRYDAIALAINQRKRQNHWATFIGVASSSPVKPNMDPAFDDIYYPLAYIYRKAGSTEITQADIENVVGTSACPLCAGVMNSMSMDQVIAQWDAEFSTWFASLKSTLDSDTAGNLKNQIDSLTKKMPYIYTAELKASMWSEVASTNSMYSKGYRYYRIQKLTKEVTTAPTTTGSSTFLPGIDFQSTGNSATDEELSEALEIINKGHCQLLSNATNVSLEGNVLIYVAEKPAVDITVRWAIMS